MKTDEYGYVAAGDLSAGDLIERFDDLLVEIESIEKIDDGTLRIHFKQEGQTGNALLSITCYPETKLKLAQ